LKFLFAIRLAKSPLLSNPPSFADVTVVGSAVSRITNSELVASVLVLLFDVLVVVATTS
jgi:hypothetical protein